MKVFDRDGLKSALSEMSEGRGKADRPAESSLAISPRSRRIGIIVSALTLVASAMVHWGTFGPDAHIAMESVWPLHLLTLVSFGSAVLAWRKGRSAEQSSGTVEGIRAARALQRELTARVPLWARATCVAAMAYTAINFTRFLAQVEGSPTRTGDTYALVNKGRLLRTINEREYRRLQTAETRGFSGHWMLFSVAALIGFVYLPKTAPLTDELANPRPEADRKQIIESGRRRT
jgi:hypothetical protein